jgi:ABC-2 type transport system permease protein
MTAPTTTTGGATAPATAAPPAGIWRAFMAILGRDLFVTGRELHVFLVQVILQPFFIIFVFGKVLTNLGFARGNYGDVLIPGTIALTIVLTALQSTALPLVIEFSFTREIEDRLLAPIPTSLVAVEKIVFSALRGLIAGSVMFPVGWLVLGGLHFDLQLGELVVFMALGALAGAAMGLLLGTAVPPNRINIVFAVVLTPLLFTGASQYPWASLGSLRWFQVVTLFNPLTYVSEGMRAALIPNLVPHMTPWVAMLVLAAATAAIGAAGIRGFRRRAVD